MRCLALCEPDTFAVSFFTHTPPAAEKHNDSLRPRLRRNGVAVKPWPQVAATDRSSDATRPV